MTLHFSSESQCKRNDFSTEERSATDGDEGVGEVVTISVKRSDIGSTAGMAEKVFG
jgi:hypothetical protein